METGCGRLVVVDAQGIARDMGAVSLTARDGQFSVTQLAPDEGEFVVSSKSAPSGLVGNVYTWAQITGLDSKADVGPGRINGTGFQIGADVSMGPDMVVGLSTSVDVSGIGGSAQTLTGGLRVSLKF